MKKKFLFLAIGALATASTLFAQVPPTPNAAGTPLTLGGFPVLITGTLNGVAVTNATLTSQSAIGMNSTITIPGVGIFAVRPATQPNAFNPLQNLLYDQFVVVDLNMSGTNNVTLATLGNPNPAAIQYGGDQVFGTQTGNFTVVPVPFDFGISAVLGAGAIAAVKTARKRRKQEEVAA